MHWPKGGGFISPGTIVASVLPGSVVVIIIGVVTVRSERVRKDAPGGIVVIVDSALSVQCAEDEVIVGGSTQGTVHLLLGTSVFEG